MKNHGSLPNSSHSNSSIPTGLPLFVLAYMILCSFAAFKQGNTEFLMYAVSMLVFITILVVLHKRVHYSPTALWLLTFWGFLHMIGGTIPVNPDLVSPDASPVLYSLRIHPDLPRYDQITHAFGFFSATVACWESAQVLIKAHPGLHLSITATLMGMGLGAINEVLEFFATLVTETNVGGYTNTGWDLVSNTIGAIVAGCWCLYRPNHPSSHAPEPQAHHDPKTTEKPPNTAA